MAVVRRATNKDAIWARAWTADSAADLADIDSPRHGDVAYVTDESAWRVWRDDGTWETTAGFSGSFNDLTDTPTTLSGYGITDAQPLDTDLTAIAALVSAADKLAYATGSGTWALTDFTAFGRSLVDDADATTARTTLGVAIGTDVQAYDADLTAIAALTGTNTIYYRSAADTWSPVTVGAGLDFTAGTLSNTVTDTGITQLTGDVTAGPGSGSQAATLSTTGVTATTYGSTGYSPQFTVDAKGRLTAASETATPTFSTLTLTGGQLAFPATQNASSDVNTLDDYEEGDWTPAIQGSAVAGTFTYTLERGRYEKIGRTVVARFRVAASAIGTSPTGFLQIAGLPFSGVAYEAPAAFLSYFTGLTAPAGATVLAAQLSAAGTTVTFVYSGPGIAATGLNASNLSAPFEFRGALIYNV